jgi:tRNA(adenine34) deaminase
MTPALRESPPLLQQLMIQALDLAREAEKDDEVPVGALVLNPQHEVIGRGRNQREGAHDPTGHAEILAIREACKNLGSWRLENCLLIVTLEPCPMCLAASHQARLSRIIYAAHDPKGGALSLGYHLHSDERTNHRFEIEQIDQPECGEILSRFFRRKRAMKKPARGPAPSG